MTIRNRMLLAAITALAAATATANATASSPASTAAGAERAPAPHYTDAASWLTADADIDAWYRIVFGLRSDFDAICGDTFCEGDYSNIQALRFRCSVEGGSGRIGECVWSFAASNEEIAPRSGRVLVEARTWRCVLPLPRATPLRAFLDALAVDEPLYAPLPGASGSVYDALGDCL